MKQPLNPQGNNILVGKCSLVDQARKHFHHKSIHLDKGQKELAEQNHCRISQDHMVQGMLHQAGNKSQVHTRHLSKLVTKQRIINLHNSLAVTQIDVLFSIDG